MFLFSLGLLMPIAFLFTFAFFFLVAMAENYIFLAWPMIGSNSKRKDYRNNFNFMVPPTSTDTKQSDIKDVCF